MFDDTAVIDGLVKVIEALEGREEGDLVIVCNRLCPVLCKRPDAVVLPWSSGLSCPDKSWCEEAANHVVSPQA
jgi:hypothetical protein